MQDEGIVATFPTGKQHVSFSEISCWLECSKKHNIRYVKHVDMFVTNPYVKFGTVAHNGCEKFLHTKVMDVESAVAELAAEWEKEKFKDLDAWKDSLESILNAFPLFIEKTFPGWELVCTEEKLFEQITGADVLFKGYVDSVIKVKNRGKDVYWIVDYKTCGWGWPSDKKRSFEVQLQLMLYKEYWAKKNNVDKTNVRCAFVLLKRNKKVNERIDMVQISVGDKTIEKALHVVSRMITGVKRHLTVFNRDACNRCEFFMTEHCNQALLTD